MSARSQGVANLSDVEAIEARGWPQDVPASTYEAIRRTADRIPSAPALSFFLTADQHRTPETWTYQQLLGEINRAANAFHSLAADEDTVIAYVLPNLPETHFVIWGGQAAGIVFSLNPLLEPEAIADLLRAAGAAIVVTLAPFPGSDTWEKVSRAVESVDSVRHVVLIDMAVHVPGPTSAPPGDAGPVLSGIAVHDFAALRAGQPEDHLVSGRVIDPEDFSSYFGTGGTTGLPKIAMRTHRNEVSDALSTSHLLSGLVGEGKNIFCGLPMFHVNAVLMTGLVPFSHGAHVVLGTPQGYRADGLFAAFWDIVQHHRIHFFSGVPTIYAALLEHPTDGYDLGSLEYGICGAAPLPVELMRRFESSTGVKILEGYGLTEGTCVSSVNPPLGERRTGSIGLRIPFQKMKAVVLDDAGAYVRDCAADEIGALVINGPNVFAGYRVAAQNANLWVDTGDGERWLNTGDLGRQDADGYFWLTGRKKELIIRGGHNIDPSVIETPLYAHPDVQYAAAVGRPDPRVGELPVVYVQLKDGATADEKDLLAYLDERIAERAARPKALRIIDSMPMTAVGKLFKPALGRRETEAALTAALRDAGFADAVVLRHPHPDLPQNVIATLPAGADVDAAAKVLGSFAFPFTITTD
jgi:fatty-acyl-CoA synthase